MRRSFEWKDVDLLFIKNSFCGADERAGKSGRAGSYGKEFWVDNNLNSLLLIGSKNRFCGADERAGKSGRTGSYGKEFLYFALSRQYLHKFMILN